jgi:hypothetical protein
MQSVFEIEMARANPACCSCLLEEIADIETPVYSLSNGPFHDCRTPSVDQGAGRSWLAFSDSSNPRFGTVNQAG